MKNKALLVSEGSVFLEKGLAILPNMDFYKTGPNVDEDLSGYALYIFDGVLPTQLPQDGHILVFNLPKENAIASLFELEDKDVTVRGQGRGALSFMNQAQFLVSKPLGMEVPVWGEKILDYGGNAIGVAGEQNGRKMVLFSFGLNQSDFPLKKEFPILLYELTNWYFPQSVTMTGSVLAGQAVALPLLPNAVSAEIALPNGEIVVAADTQPAPLFEETGQVGVYTLTQMDQAGGKTESWFAVNPQITGESDALWPVADEAVAVEQETVQKSKSLQRGILLVLLLLLLIEWRVSLHEN